MTKTYTDFSRRLHQRAVADRIPVNGTIELTHRCPLRCVHCYNNRPAGDRNAQRGERSAAEWRRVLDDLAEAGCLWLLFTGGEPLLRPDFFEVYDHARRLGILPSIFTNGFLLTERNADRLAEARPFAIEISLYGMTRETFEGVTRTPGSFDRCMRAIRLLHERQLPLRLKTVALTINLAELESIRRFAEEELGVMFRFDAAINCRLDCSQAPLEFRLSPEQTVELDFASPERLAEWRALANRCDRGETASKPDRRLYQCGGGTLSFSIDPVGRLAMCPFVTRQTYDLSKGRFADGWNDFLKDIGKRRTSRDTICTRCALRSLCGMCPANGELENGDPESPVEFLCRLGHLRAYALGLGVPPHGDCAYCAGGAQFEEIMRTALSLQSRHLSDNEEDADRRGGYAA